MPFSEGKTMELGKKWWTSYKVILVDPFPIEKLYKFVQIWILVQKKKVHRTKNFRKKAISEAEMMEFCIKMMNILNSLAHWSVSHQKVAQIKQAPKWKFKKKCHFRGQNDGIWPKNDDPPVESYSLTHCQSKGCTNLWESEFRCKKMSTKMKIFEKNAMS